MTVNISEGEHSFSLTNLDGSIDVVTKVIGFTGTRSGMTPAQKEKVKAFLIEQKPQKVLHGMCIGADEEFHNICKELGIFIEGFPGKSAMGDNVTYRSICEPDVVHEEETHFARNRRIVDLCDILIGCPYNDVQTGGTWYTINYAIKQNKPLIFV